jgi:hypothetical protein
MELRVSGCDKGLKMQSGEEESIGGVAARDYI